MIHDERIVLMTKMQSYEDNGGKKDIAVANYFRGDYIGLQVLKSIIYITIAAAVVYVGYIFYHLEELLKNLYQMDWIEYMKTLITRYLILVVVYSLITYLVYTYRYFRAKKNLKKYFGMLKRLSSMYQNEK